MQKTMKLQKQSNMKKLIVLVLSAFILFNLSFTINAAEKTDINDKIVSIETEDLGNGYIKETIITETTPSTNERSLAVSKSGSKTVNFKNSSNQVLWSLTVKGTFLYDQYTSSCTASSVSTNVKDSNWRITSSSADRGGNTAYGYATAKRYLAGVVVQTVNETVSLSCSKTGVLS